MSYSWKKCICSVLYTLSVNSHNEENPVQYDFCDGADFELILGLNTTMVCDNYEHLLVVYF